MDRLNYQINLAAEHGLGKEITAVQQNFLIAGDCASTVAGLFWLINYAVEDEAFQNDINRDALFLSLTRIARIGTAVAEELSKRLSVLEDETEQSAAGQ